ncbi:glycerophosphodiester phosphodiesterase [Halogeometricum sp. S1BR25-6]|uniref:Glycerophosphodiester phosphodiesterase n=1 Tax=Halogeometricum salsisoli TaxID=2950536 RepID=A0ABU2GDW1_9EURY|nr:glycerophosphodiester phosphodiesterase family protein [Halogeometricum sp. S1BR25-6]MDS0298504.1 glycerophosphodiester phosphodiesterase [Halogeometricum sp. S1BR25-6]
MSRDTHEFGRRSFVAGTGALLGASSLGGVAGATHDGADGTDSESDEGGTERGWGGHPEIIAHRGFAGVYPENTLGAFGRATWGDGADMIEIDVIPSKDGEVMVIHDPDLSSRDEGTRGLTDLDGYVWEYTAEELQEANVLQSGETVPTLGEVLDLVPDSVGVNVEFKNPDTTDIVTSGRLSEEELAERMETWRPLTERVFEVASRYENEILVSSFAEAAIAVVRDVDPDVPVAYLFFDSIETGLEITREYDCEAMHPPYDMIKGTPFFGNVYSSYEDIDLVEIAREEDRTLNVWTIGTWYQAEQLAAAGVDGLIADYPNLLWSGNDEMEWERDDSEGETTATETESGTETGTETETETETPAETESSTETTAATETGTETETPTPTGTETDDGN